MLLDRSIGYASAFTVATNLLSLLLAGVVHMNYRVLGISIIFGWLPILIVAIQGSKKPTPLDVIIMFGGFPATLASVVTLTTWLL